MTARLDISLFSALCLLLAVTFCSCSQIYDDEGPCEQEQKKGNGISLKFKIYTEPSSTSTRTRGLGVWEEDPANISERILNPRDMRVLIFNANGNLARTFKPNKLDYVEEGGITGDGYYELSIYFEDENLDRWEDNERIDFSVIILANINSLDGIYTTDGLSYGVARNTIQELFTMPAGWFPSETKGIPMYGYRSGISASKAKLAAGDFLVEKPINMLRALCKIEVYDKIIGAQLAPNGKKYPHVEKVELISWRDKGYLRPLHDSYESGLTQANIPSSTVITDERQWVNARPMNDGVDIDKDGTIDPCFRLYCPEAELANVKLKVTLAMTPPNEFNQYDSKQYEVSLGQYADGDKANPVFGNDLVRNHIYRFKVNSLSAMADLTVTVSPWGSQVDEYTLDDIISMDNDGYLKWTWDSKNNDDFSVTDVTYNGKELKQLNILHGTTDYATGTFKINSPKGATWRAFFIPGENGVDAFEFVTAVDADGKATATSSFVEGVIGDTEATIRVQGKGPADVYRHTAELVVEVHQADGTVLYAPLTSDGKTSYVIYRENKL